MNKVIRASYADENYCKLALEAIEMWKSDPVFANCFFNSRKIQVPPPDEPHNEGAIEAEKRAMYNLAKYGHKDTVQKIQGGEQLAKLYPEFSENSLADGLIDFVGTSGFGLAARSVKQAYEHCIELGVRFVLGEAGKITEFGENYVISQFGVKTTGDKVIICCGAANGYLIDFGSQIRVLGEFVAHIQLTPEEVEIYKNMPIVHTVNGFYFPPDPETGLVKLVVQNMRALHTINSPQTGQPRVSLPKYESNGKMNGIPQEAIESLRKLIQSTIPRWLGKPLIKQLICWCANTLTMDWIIDKVPGFDNVYVCAGDSGHAYKFLPNIGHYVVDLMEGQLSEELSRKWKWNSDPKWPDVWPAGCAHSQNIELENFTWT